MIRAIIGRLYHVASDVPVLRDLALLLRNRYRHIKGKPPLVYVDHRTPVEALPALPDAALYDKLIGLNVVDTARVVVVDFYKRLGLDPQRMVTVQLLSQAREDLAARIDLGQAGSTGSLLVRFEAAWQRFQTGEIPAAVEAFRTLLAEPSLLQLAGHSTYLREVLIRSAEIVGRDAEVSGDTARAIDLYEQIMAVGNNGVIAHRLALLLWRVGRIRDSAMWAEKAIWSDQNLAPIGLRENPYVREVTAMLAKPR